MTGAATAMEEMQRLLADPERVTDEQRGITIGDGNFIVLACPGSGKTRAVGLRLAWAIADGKGRHIAATSYTNTAVDEIRRAVVDTGSLIGPEHFTGTLHALLLRYVVYPFGHLVMMCPTVPRVVSREQYPFVGVSEVRVQPSGPGVPIWNFEVHSDGSFTVRLPDTIHMDEVTALNRGVSQAKKIKAELFRRGILSFSDAMYVAFRVLKRRPDIAKNVAERFDEIIVDEMQDTTALQFASLQLLKDAGLKSIVMLGDMDQAIYGWSGGAGPSLAPAFAEQYSLGELRLTRNFRSSQRICDVAAAFSTREAPDVARGSSRSFDATPELITYPRLNPRAAVDYFNSRLATLQLDSKRSAVLVRASSFIRELDGARRRPKTTPSVAVLGETKAEFSRSGALSTESIRRLEAMLAEWAWGGDAALEARTSDAALELRSAAFKLVTALPPLSGTLYAWIQRAKAAASVILGTLTQSPAVQLGGRIRSTSKANDETSAVESTFGPASLEAASAQTVHAVKGESYDAVLLVSDRPRSGRNQGRAWIAHRLGESRTEETNVAYVALTRARRFMAVAVPSGTPVDVLEAYVTAGFSRRDL